MTRITASPIRAFAALCGAAVLGLGATGCMAGTGMSPAMVQQASAMHHFAMAVHMGELEEAQLALTKTQNAQVRAFAQKMVDDHRMGMQMEERMTMSMRMDHKSGSSSTAGGNSGANAGGEMHMDMARMRAELAADPASRPVMEDHMRAMQMLQALNGAQFDRAYMERQVVAHRYALEQMDRMMGQLHPAMHGSAGASASGGAHAGHAGMSGSASGSMNPGAITMGTREGMMAMHMQERAMVAAHLQQAQQLVAAMR